VADIHITRELLSAVARGELPPRMLVETGLQHLTSLCPHCREEYLAWQREQSGASDEIRSETLPALLKRHTEELSRRHEAAERECRELLRLSHAVRLARIRRATSRFRGAVLAGMLLDESKKIMAADPTQAYDLAETADTVLIRSPAAPQAADQQARAAAYMANALRARGDLRGARERFKLARFIIQTQGVTNPLIYAEVDSAEASLSMDQRRFRDAEALLNRSVILYSLAGAKPQIAHPLVTLGLLHYHRGEYAKAVEMTQAATHLIHLETDPRLYLSARHNLALFLCEAGSCTAAAEVLQADRGLYRQFPDLYTQLRLQWLDGKIAQGLGQDAEAERALGSAREGFRVQGIGYDAAMVSLDLALIYLKQGRRSELIRLAEEMHEIFKAGDVHREAVAALLLFEETVRTETLSAELVQELSWYLKRAQGNPEMRFKRKPAS
jgi:tetratricopeptide (TPR) repeat protein